MQHTILIAESYETVTTFGINMDDVERLSLAGEKVREFYQTSPNVPADGA